jgi:hypothetical protein
VCKGVIGGLRARLEEGGNLVEGLNRLVALGEQREELRSRAKMAMVYPAVLLSLGVIVVFVMIAFVVQSSFRPSTEPARRCARPQFCLLPLAPS